MTMAGRGETRWWIDGPVGYAVLDHPPMNLLTEAVREGLLAALEAFRRDRVRAVVLTGAGDRAFCAGADLGEEAELTAETAREFHRRVDAAVLGLRRLEAPVVGAINGFAMGGGLVLALWCDVRIGSTNARLGAVGVKVGLVASNVQLSRLLPEGRARDLLLTGRTVEAAEAYKVGLLSAVVPPERLLPTASAWAAGVAARDPAGVARAKRVLDFALDLALDAAEAREEEVFAA